MAREDARFSRQQRETYNARQEQELVSGQRRRLESLLQRQDHQQRFDAFDKLLALPELQPADLKALSELLAQAPDTDRREMLTRICTSLPSRMGQPDTPSEDFTGLLRLLSAHAQGPREPGALRRNNIALVGLNLTGLQMNQLDLRGSILRQSNWEAAELPGLNLFAARLEQVGLPQARLTKANLTGATLLHVNLNQASLKGAELISAELNHCDLRGAEFDKANFRGARLNDCDLRGADLSQAQGLTYQQLLSNRIDEQTRLPANLAHRRSDLLTRSQVP